MSTRTVSRALRRASVAVLAVTAVTLTGCAGSVALDPGPDANSVQCAEVMVSLPDTIGAVDLQRRTTNAQSTAAWGDPTAVIYRCGLPEQGPSDLPCFDVDGVDWLLDESDAPRYVFTTYGRTPVTEIIVDVTYIAGSDAVRELSPFIAARIDASERCLVATDVFGGGTVGPTPTPTPTPTP